MRTTWMVAGIAAALLATSAPAQAGDIPVLTGGVGASDRAALAAQENQYALKLVYSGEGGAYLASVHTQLLDASGAKLLSVMTEGPILLLNPPAGTYTLLSTASGIEQRQQVTVGSGHKTYQIRFPIKDNPELTDEQGTYLPKAQAPMAVRPFGSATPSGYVPADSAH